MGLAILVAVGLVGGGYALLRGDQREVTASVEGPHLRISVGGVFNPGEQVRVGDHEVVADEIQSGLWLYVPAEAYGAGQHDVEVDIKAERATWTPVVSVDIPDAALEPQVQLRNCFAERRGPIDLEGLAPPFESRTPTPKNEKTKRPQIVEAVASRDAVHERFGDDGTGGWRKKDRGRCYSRDGGDFHITVHANHDAEVTIDGQKVALEGGVGELVVPLRRFFQAMTVGDGQAIDEKQAPSLELDVLAARDGRGRKSSFSLRLAHDFELREVAQRALDEVKLGRPVPWMKGDRGLLFHGQPSRCRMRGAISACATTGPSRWPKRAPRWPNSAAWPWAAPSTPNVFAAPGIGPPMARADSPR